MAAETMTGSFLLLEHLLPPSAQTHPLCNTPVVMGPQAVILKPRQRKETKKGVISHFAFRNVICSSLIPVCAATACFYITTCTKQQEDKDRERKKENNPAQAFSKRGWIPGSIN